MKTDGYFFSLLYTYVCSVMKLYCPGIFGKPGFDVWAPQNPQNMKKNYIGFKLKKFLEYCFLILRVHRYGSEDSWKAI